LDFPADTVENIIEKYILDKLADHTQMSMKSYKSHLQEHIQKKYKVTPHYEEKEIGKNPGTHEIIYSSDVYMEKELLGT
jgi:dsRNA-specific ribonuclease